MRKKNKLLQWAVLFNPLFLLLIWNGMRVLSLVCQYGGLRKRVPVLLLTGVVGIAWILIWSMWMIKNKRKENLKHFSKISHLGILLIAELLLLACIIGFYGARIYVSAINLNGKLAWYLHDRTHSKSIELTHDDFFEDGVQGILLDIEEKIELPKELYVENIFQIEVQGDGTINEMYAFLYGKDKYGHMQTYLLDYDRNKNDNMTVWVGGVANTTYEEKQKLQPMIDLVEAFNGDSSIADTIKHQGEESQFLFSYFGYEEELVTSELYILDSNGTLQLYETEYDGNPVEGYLVELSCNEEQFMILNSDQQLEDTEDEDSQEGWFFEDTQEEQSGTNAKVHEPGQTVTDENGNMYFYLNEMDTMILHVTDAALGSRAYSFESFYVENETPFGENIGVASGMYFKDENTGFALLGNASMDYSELYGTMDGGENFILISLPVEMGEADLAGNAYGFTTQDYDFQGVPYEEDGVFYVKVGTDSVELEIEYMLFQSTDGGITWNYVKYVSVNS